MKQDHRVRLTKLLLREAFLDLLVEKPVAKITVKELCEQANVNRATFYAHYRDLFDLHEEIERDLAHTIMRSLSTTLPSQSLSAFSNEICRIIVDNERSCQAIFGEHGDPEFPLRVVETLRESSIALWRQQRPDLPEAELDRLYTFMANGCLAVISSGVPRSTTSSSHSTPSMPGASASCCLNARACSTSTPFTMTRALGTAASNSASISSSARVDSADSGR